MKIASVHRPRRSRRAPLPFAACSVRAGFPSPAADYLESPLDLNTHLIQHKSATFIVRARGDSMDGAGIRDGALLIVDRALEATDGSIVIAVVDGDLTVKRLRKKKDRSWLEAANPKYPPIEVTTEDVVWGVVAHAVNTYHR